MDEKKELLEAGLGLTEAEDVLNTKEKSQESSKTKIDSFFEALPKSLNTRRRYSAFRPVPFPSQSGTVLEPTASVSIISGNELIERVSVAGTRTIHEGPLGASDLDLFLQNKSIRKDRFNRQKDDFIDGPKKECSHGLFAVVILLGLFTLCQILTFSCLFAIGEFSDSHSTHNHSNIVTSTSTTKS